MTHFTRLTHMCNAPRACAGAGFLPMLPEFKRLLPHIRPITLTASVLFYVPAIKELSLWLGFRQVRALRSGFQTGGGMAGSGTLCLDSGSVEALFAFCEPDLLCKDTHKLYCGGGGPFKASQALGVCPAVHGAATCVKSLWLFQ